MAVQLPSGLYNQYTEVFNTSPIMQANLQRKQRLEAQKIAKEEALNQYFSQLPEKINKAGVRDVDTPFITQDVDNLRRKFIENQRDILRGGQAQAEFMADFDRISQKVERSKNRGKLLLDLGKAKFEGKFDPDKDDLTVISNIEKSVYDPSSYKQDNVSEYGYEDLSPNIPEFDADKQSKFWSTATKGLQAGKQYDYSKKTTDSETGQVLVPYQKVYSPQQIKSIADEAGKLALGDKSARRYYNKMLDNPEELDRLDAAYQSVYGDKATVETVEQAAQAEAIMRASTPQEVGQEQEINWKERNQAAINKIYIQDGLIRGRANDKKNELGSLDLSKYPKEGDSYNVTKAMQGIKVARAGGVVDISANKILFNPNSQTISFTDLTGNTETLDFDTFVNNVSTINTVQDLNRVKILGNSKEPKSINKNDKPSGKVYKVGNKTFTEEQIKKGAAKYKMTESEYLKSIGAN